MGLTIYDQMSPFAETIFRNKYSYDGKETWSQTAKRVTDAVLNGYVSRSERDGIFEIIRAKKFIPGGRYLYAAGRQYPQVNNCFLFSVEDSRLGWGTLMNQVTQSLMTGGGIGVDYSKVRAEGSHISGLGGKSTGPCALMQMVNEVGRHVVQGGSRRSAIWAGLVWDHPDVLKFIKLKDWSELHQMGKAQDFNFPAPMDMTNISVILTDSFFEAYSNPQHAQHELAHQVYWGSIENMLKTGEPGFSIDIGKHAGETLRNACTEITSRDSGDVCNLGSINLARISSLQEMKDVVSLATLFLICGTLYSKLPLDIMYEVREKNRRLGLGLMGLHEWLLRHNKRYGPDEDLERYLKIYKGSSLYAESWAGQLSVSCPVATRAIAPTGTISIVAETTSGCEPITYVALKRRYLSGKIWKAQYIVDPTAKRLIEEGIPEDAIEDSVTLSSDVERRIQFQHWLQKYVDHGISSTINLPPWGSELNNESRVRAFGETLLKYLPGLRGITTYPDGARYGQPLVRVPYQEAIQSEGVEIEEGGNCKSGVCGI